MNKWLIILILLLFVISSVIVCIFKPKTHKPIVFEDRKFEISMMTKNAEADKNDINIEMPDINIQAPEISVNIETPKIQIETPKVNINNVSKPKTNTAQQKPTVKKTQSTTQTKPTTNPQTKKEQVKPVKQEPVATDNNKNENKQENKKEEQKPEQVKAPEKTIAKDNPAPVVTTPPTQKVLTEQEEIIAWNKWRSDLQNKLMRDSRISAPIGTSFLFSFTVDKYGNITNLKTWSNNQSYTPLAVKVIKPLLLSYQHTSILKFPTGSQRIITNASGGFTMAKSTKYSSPSDFNDYERVTR